MTVQQPLDVVFTLFSQWQESGVKYCHWKSNQHLVEGLTGETDLDVLIDESQASICELILESLDYKRVMSPYWARYDNVYDWIGFDRKTGRSCHIHLHYKIVVGRKYIKNIHLPLELWLLQHTRLQNNIQVPEYERELILLIIRITLKTSLTSAHLPNDIRRELDWLIKRSNKSKINTLIKEAGFLVNPDIFMMFIERYSANKLSRTHIWKLKKELRPVFKKFRNISMIETLKRRLCAVYARCIKLLGRERKKSLLGRGVYVAVVGCDGSGKTSLVLGLKKWFGWKMRVSHVYFGIPKTFPIRHTYIVYKLLFALMYRLIPITRFVLFPVEERIDAIWWLYLAIRRKRLQAKCMRMQKKGYVVLAERFPLRDFWSMGNPMDGPRIKNKNSTYFKKIRGWERLIYTSITLPDQVYILRVGIEELRRRKPYTNAEQRIAKEKAIRNLPNNRKYSFINAEESYDEVLRSLKCHIWQEI